MYKLRFWEAVTYRFIAEKMTWLRLFEDASDFFVNIELLDFIDY